MHFKMHFQCVLMLIFVISDDSLGFDVRGPSGPLVVPLGGSAILPCYVETPLEEVKVVWKRTDSETLVHLYQDGESRPEAQHKDYHHRAHFFTDQIQHGNFSLLLENVRAEDEGVYRCKVYSQQLADKTLVEIKHVECLLVSGSDRSVSAYDGEDVTLSCSVDSHITPEHIEEVSWRKTDGDILVLLFQNNKTFSDSSDERYRDRAELFTAEIPKGNFSLRLKSVRTEDKGVYMCHVFAGGLSANATVVLVQLDSLGFDVRGPSGPLVVPLGGSAILPCYVETPLEKVKVVWKRTDSETLVHLYQDGESRPEAQHKDYHHRAHFFTDQIQHGNFSLLLANVRAEDEGVYRCKVYSQQLADKTLVEIKHVELLIVSGSDRSVSAYDGEDVTLSCSVDSHITPEHIEEVSWRKTDGDILVLLFQNNKTLSDSSDERYRGRAELFTAEIPKGNFSLRLKSVRTEDKGVYMCHVFAGGLSANATVVLVQLGFSWLHITAMILCIFASGSALLSWLVYFRTGNRDNRLCLQVCLFLCPDITMLLASIIWFVIEGSLYETVSCCMLYVLGPLRLFWVKPLTTGLPDKILKSIMISHTDHAAFMAVMYSVLLAEHFPNVSTVFTSFSFGLLVLMCLLFITRE
uniref:Ig-like domain-containing protein n=1 Tax=Cyprinus carpio TaxID=7962 RepID=A0A8C1SXK3_CYPCA